ncbi:MAG TPA: DUF6112 family protein [Acidimicrobiales bacterium]|nr:DUF6112 family protein [Acidimicrobiales bacterium]
MIELWEVPFHAMVRPVTLAAAGVTASPDPNALPGGPTLQKLVDGLDWWALLLALAGLIIGAAAWALGAHSQNYHQSIAGRRAVLVSALAALLIGAAPYVVGFFFHTGQAAGS